MGCHWDHFIGSYPGDCRPLSGRINSLATRFYKCPWKSEVEKRDSNGNLFGHSDPDPIKDTRTYEVEFPGGEIAELTANAIAEAMYAQCDDDGNEYLLFDCIVDHKKNDKGPDQEDPTFEA